MAGLTLNPMAFARISRDGASIELRALARGRSFRPLCLQREEEPALFDALAEWLSRGGRAEPPPPLAAEQTMRLIAAGLLLTPAEAAALPADAHAREDGGSAAARWLCPPLASLLDAGIAPPPMPPGVDAGFASAGHASLQHVLAPQDLALLRQWYAALCDGGWLRRDTGAINRLIVHNDPAARAVLEGLAPWLAAVTGMAIAPSYAFFSQYQSGADLPRHTDRDQCEVTVSLFVEYLPAEGSSWPADAACPWPLVIHAPEGDVAVHQPPGGGPVFRGRALEHSRPPLPPGDRARMLFLHYVAADFSGPLD